MIRQRRPGGHPYSQSPSQAQAAAPESTLLSTPVPRAESTSTSTAAGKGRPKADMMASHNIEPNTTDQVSSPSPPPPPPSSDERRPLLAEHTGSEENDQQAPSEQQRDDDDGKMGWVRQNKWVVLAIASGACAAFNGVFAKLTTTELTTNFAQGIARVFHLDFAENVVEYAVRAIFFGLNLLFNGIMWTLFTQALAKGHSTTQVSIMNTSSNFVITAMLGLLIFSESLPPLWWVGATLLVAGNVIIGTKDESGKPSPAGEDDREGVIAPAPGLDGLGDYEDVPQIDGILDPELKDEDEDILELGELRD